MNMEEKLPEIDYLTLAAVCHRPRIEANKELVKWLMKCQVDKQWKYESALAETNRRDRPAPRYI